MLFISAAFMPSPRWNAVAVRSGTGTPLFPAPLFQTSGESADRNSPSLTAESEGNLEKNSAYIHGLLENLTAILDKWITNGSPAAQKRAANVLWTIESEAMDPELVKRAVRMIQRAGLSLAENPSESSTVELGATDEKKRRQEAEARKRFEESRTSEVGETVAANASGRSALSRRATTNDKPDLFLGQVVAQDKKELEKALGQGESPALSGQDEDAMSDQELSEASAKVSQMVAKAGAGSAFQGETLGIGGLDDVLAQVKRRVWIPLAAPPQLLEELGIHPVRGLLLYGKPGCGKTLLASKLGQMLSPLRPITVVSGPEIMDKFVGSSEKNLREIFDNPPDIYDFVRSGQADGGDAIAKTALHVIIMDEFDAIARARGGRGGTGGDQSDAGVARDSVVNQLLVKMDGVDPLVVPTLVIGLTNRRSLIEPALLRPGRFEVQVEVPPPTTNEQRESILKVHTKHMQNSGRLFVSNAPDGSAAARQKTENLLSYEELLETLAEECDGFSGASLAGVARAAASHALERAVEEFTQHTESASLLRDCVVTKEDFDCAMQDVRDSLGDADWAESEDEQAEKEDSTTMEEENDDSTGAENEPEAL
jgi:ATP-dependent 26S proteasome regulatory subunit